MDDERDRLVSALRTRLSELDAKVGAYRRDQADEFRRYASRLLSTVAADVATDVAHTINSEASDRTDGHVRYAALYPGFLRDGGPDTADVVVLAGAPLLASFSLPSPARPPVLPDESPPRDRNRNDDFRGVFTPPFLPLLDGSSHSRPARSLPDTTSTTATITTAAAETAAIPLPAPSPPLSTPSLIPLAEEVDEADEPELEPEPQRRLKSALRRPSSSLSLSTRRPCEPRRVRFSFDGEEVLPTSSPPRFEDEQDFSWLVPNHHSHSIGATFDDIDLARYSNNINNISNSNSKITSTLPEDLGVATAFVDTYAAHDPLAAGCEQEPLFLSAGDDSQQRQPAGDQNCWGPSTGSDDNGLEPHSQAADDKSSLQDHRRRHNLILDDDELEFVPLARRLSSSDLLRALSKVPLEDPSMWTVVDPQSDPADVQLDASSFVSKPKVAEDRIRPSLPLRGEDSTQGSEEQLQRDAFNLNDSHTDKEEDGSYSDPFITMRSSREAAQPQKVVSVAESPTTPSNLSVALSRSPQEPIAAEPSSPAMNGAAAAAATVATEIATTTTTTTTTAPPVQAMPISRTARQSPSPPKKLAPQTEAEPAEDDDFFEFEHDNNGDSDDVVGYPLTRVSSARPYNGDEDSDADDAETALAEASELEDEQASRQDVEKASELFANKGVGDAVDAGDAGNLGNVKSGPLQGLPAILANHRQMMPRDVSQSLNRASLNRASYGQNQNLNQSQNISISLGSAQGATSASFGHAGTTMPTAPTVPTSPTTPTTPTSPSFAASVGSYRGRPISMFNVVKDPRILQEVAQLGEFSSFVGGVDGRTGVDGVDDVVGSFAARDLQSQNSMGLSGTPRSLSERMAMEEIFRGRR